MLRLRSTILGNFRFKGKQLASIAINHPDRGDLTAVCDLLIFLYEYLKKSTISLADCRYLPPNTTGAKQGDIVLFSRSNKYNVPIVSGPNRLSRQVRVLLGRGSRWRRWLWTSLKLLKYLAQTGMEMQQNKYNMFFSLILCALLLGLPSAELHADEKPNIVVILCDDLGYVGEKRGHSTLMFSSGVLLRKRLKSTRSLYLIFATK